MPNKKTKIVATLGPASDNIEVMEAMVKAGVNIFRLNFSHGTHEYHASNIAKVRELEAKLGVRIGVLQDICGPKIRCGKLAEPFSLKRGDRLDVYASERVGKMIEKSHYAVSINQPQILPMLRVGEYIYLYDGSIRARVVVEGRTMVQTVIENDGVLNSNKGVNFPNTKIGIDVITPKDREDMAFGAKHGVDFVAISFVQDANDVKKARSVLAGFGSKAVLIAKIEKFDAVENIDEIIKASDAIMVARGDLGIEVPYYKVPMLQKCIIKKANAASKPVITATQMMLSMAESETATRAEISDVANAVLDGTDAVMLSEESAIGKNPVAVVEAMSNTIVEIQNVYPYNKFDEFTPGDETEMVAASAARLAVNLGVDAMITITSTGKSALNLSKNRANIEIIAVTHDEIAARTLTLAWGVTPAYILPRDRLSSLLANTVKIGVEKGFIKHGRSYLLTAGHPAGVSGSTDLIRILRQEQIEYYLSEPSKA